MSIAGVAFGEDFTSSFDSVADLNATGTSVYSWSATATEGSSITVDETDKAEGTGALQISGTGAALNLVSTGTSPSGVLFYHFKIRPQAVPQEGAETVIDAGGAKIGFIQQGEDGAIVAATGTGGESKTADSTFDLDSNGFATEWLTVTVRVDSNAGVWDAWVNGFPAFTGISRGSGGERPDSFLVEGESQGPVKLDDFRLSTENPLFSDRDHDGLPDAYEMANNLNTNAPDGDSDWDSNGVSNSKQFADTISGVLNGGEAGNSTKVVYVDAGTGSDSGTGLVPYPIMTDTPKKTIEAALSTVAKGDELVIQGNEQPYHLDEYRGPDIQVRTDEGVQIRGNYEDPNWDFDTAVMLSQSTRQEDDNPVISQNPNGDLNTAITLPQSTRQEDDVSPHE